MGIGDARSVAAALLNLKSPKNISQSGEKSRDSVGPVACSANTSQATDSRRRHHVLSVVSFAESRDGEQNGFSHHFSSKRELKKGEIHLLVHLTFRMGSTFRQTNFFRANFQLAEGNSSPPVQFNMHNYALTAIRTMSDSHETHSKLEWCLRFIQSNVEHNLFPSTIGSNAWISLRMNFTFSRIEFSVSAFFDERCRY